MNTPANLALLITAVAGAGMLTKAGPAVICDILDTDDVHQLSVVIRDAQVAITQLDLACHRTVERRCEQLAQDQALRGGRDQRDLRDENGPACVD